MKRGIVLFLLILMSSLVIADEEVFDGEISPIDSLEVGNLDYDIRYSISAEKMSFLHPLNKLILGLNDCDIRGYYRYCFENVTHHVEKEDMKAFLKVEKLDCISYTPVGKNRTCKLETGDICESDLQCVIGKCLHGICSNIFPVCGDGYCDSKEICEFDCRKNVEEIEPGTYLVNAKKDWTKLMDIEVGKSYTFEIEGEYSIGEGEKVGARGRDEVDPGMPCPEVNKGALVGDVCGQCMIITTNALITPRNNCEMRVRVNDFALFDNSGNVTVKVFQSNVTSVDENTTDKIVSKMKDYIRLRNDKRYGELSRMGEGNFADFYSAYNLVDDVDKEHEIFLEKIEISSYEIEAREEGFVLEAVVKNESDNLVFYMSQEMVFEDVSFRGKNMSKVEFEEVKEKAEEEQKKRDAIANLQKEDDKEDFPWFIVVIVVLVLFTGYKVLSRNNVY